jgi:hypothetical protein
VQHSFTIIDKPDWMPAQYQHPGNNFESRMDRLRFVAPALATVFGSDPEHIIQTRCQTNGIPAHLRAKAPAEHWDEQVASEELSNNNTEDPPLLSVPYNFSSNDQWYSKGVRSKERSGFNLFHNFKKYFFYLVSR